MLRAPATRPGRYTILERLELDEPAIAERVAAFTATSRTEHTSMMAGSPRSATLTLAAVRATGQPPQVLARLNDEHWAGRLYMRRFSPYATVVFARLGWSPNAVTVAFIVSGVAAGVVTAIPGLAAAVGVAVLIQLYLLFDCSDGELAR